MPGSDTCVEYSDSAPPPTGVTQRATTVESRIDSIQAEIETVLETLPRDASAAGELLSSKLELEPTPELLHAIMCLAHDAGGYGPLRDLARSALALRILSDRELHVVFDSAALDAAALGQAAVLMPSLLMIVTTLEEELQSRLESVDATTLEYARNVNKWIVPERETLIAAAVLAPRLSELAALGDGEQILAAFPALGGRDASMIASVNRGQLETDEGDRCCINARVLQMVIDEDLDELARLAEGSPDDPAVTASRAEAVARLERAKQAYDVFAERLQERQDAALVSGSRETANRLRMAKQGLFSTYLALVAGLKNPEALIPARKAPQASARLEELLERCAEGEAAIDAPPAADPTEALCREALHDLAQEPAGSIEDRSEEDVRRDRQRNVSLAIISGLLFTAALVIYSSLMTRPEFDPVFRADELPPSIHVSRAITIGPMMYAQVNRILWDDLTQAERLSRVEQLGRVANDRGLQTVFLTDEKNANLARWTLSQGPTLIKN